ncbi:MAG: cbb3-type cytochrome oxidase assembly protein CcoS [Ginsengibacter sp.]
MLIIIIGISILVAASFLIAFLWSARSGQYDDDYTPSVRMLFDDSPASSKKDEEKSPPLNYKNSLSNLKTG